MTVARSRTRYVVAASAVVTSATLAAVHCSPYNADAPTEASEAGSPAADASAPPAEAGSNDGAPPPDASDCPGRAGPVAKRVGTLLGAEFCIDTTEVTRAQYVEFLQSNPQPIHPRCMFKAEFRPDQNWPPSASEGDLPVLDVDWCDAWHYCAWAGKRLCGKIGGGTLSEAERKDHRASQFFHACTGGGATLFAYGNDYEPGRCHGPDAEAPVPVGSMPGCQGGFPGVFDLTGNANEMIDSCVEGGDGGPANDPCYAMGGSFTESNGETAHRCTAGAETRRGKRYRNLGFRCCGP